MHDRRPLQILAPGVVLLGLVGCAAPEPSSNGPSASQPSSAASSAGSQPPRAPLSPTERATLREASIERLESLALSNDPQQRANAIEGLRWAPQRAEPIVRAALADENPGVRFAAAMTAGRLNFRTLLPLVEPLRADPDPHVRLASIYALTRLGRAPSQQPLADALRSTDPRLRAQAAFVLGEIGERSAAPMLLEAARNAPPTGTIAQRALFDLQAAEARVKLGDTTATDAIVSALYPATIEGFEASVLAAQIIGEQNIRDAISQLVAIIESRIPSPGGPTDWRAQDPARAHLYPIELRLAAGTALAQLGFRDAGPVAESALTSPNPLVRAQAATLLAQLARPQDIQRLGEMLESADPMIQAAAATGLLKALQSGR
ncbi:MAG: HEAT repeat domain-containing protein [Phycisphaerales bacterium]